LIDLDRPGLRFACFLSSEFSRCPSLMGSAPHSQVKSVEQRHASPQSFLP
jgi:hypothetical protein